MIFLAKPSVYHLPGTWETQPMIVGTEYTLPVVIILIILAIILYKLLNK
tara:strand:+ start:387 stop:533 length:147 start_codon:yes stop_codon:yes gene_type:complete